MLPSRLKIDIGPGFMFLNRLREFLSDVMVIVAPYLLYGLAFICVSIVAIGFHVRTKRPLYEQSILPFSHEQSILPPLQEKSILPSLYCTDPSIHTNCLFTRSLCYNIASAKWQTYAQLKTNWTGISLRSRGSLFRDSPLPAACNDPFIPEHHSFPDDKAIYWINVTNVMSCIWVNVFGHIFLEMMLPAWMAMRNLADHVNFIHQNIKPPLIIKDPGSSIMIRQTF